MSQAAKDLGITRARLCTAGWKNMGSRSLAPLLAAQVALFLFGALAWLALHPRPLRQHPALRPGGDRGWRSDFPSGGFPDARCRQRAAATRGQTFAADSRPPQCCSCFWTRRPRRCCFGADGIQVIAVNRAQRASCSTRPTPCRHGPAALRRPTACRPAPRPCPSAGGRGCLRRQPGRAGSKPARSTGLLALTDISADGRAAEAAALRDLLRVLNHELMNALTPVASMSRSALDLLREERVRKTSARRSRRWSG
ncbi:hypothetical protein ACRAWD_06390 [Caulobacter segnis]